jgi:hypothetical protein
MEKEIISITANKNRMKEIIEKIESNSITVDNSRFIESLLIEFNKERRKMNLNPDNHSCLMLDIMEQRWTNEKKDVDNKIKSYNKSITKHMKLVIEGKEDRIELNRFEEMHIIQLITESIKKIFGLSS